jgi:hypothetical protein
MLSPHVSTVAVEEPFRQAWSSELRNVTANVPYGDAAVKLIPKHLQAHQFQYADIRTGRGESSLLPCGLEHCLDM